MKDWMIRHYFLERAIRGAKIGSGFILGTTALGAVATGIVTGILNPEEVINTAEFIYEHPNEAVTALGLFTMYGAAMGAAIDSFRPTSRLFERHIKETVEAFNSIKNGALKTYNFLKDLRMSDLLRMRDNLTRPDQERARKIFFPTSILIGSAAGGLFWGGNKIFNNLDQMFGLNSIPLATLVTDHPVEVIGAGAIVGLGIATGIVAFQESDN